MFFLVSTNSTQRLSDHLGSSSVTTNANGVKTASALYKAFGETRYFSGSLGTDYKFTGQREEASLGLYFFVSRWFDPSLGRFTSPDTIVPTSTQGTQAWDRYAFVNNNPVRYNDPTGHDIGWGQIFTGIALIADVVGTILSGVEMVVVDSFAVSVIVAGCATGLGCGPAIATAIGAYIAISEISPIGIAENITGAVGFLATGAADFASGASYIEPNESGGIAIGIGQNTLVSALTMDLGFLPEANIDFVVSVAQLSYDVFVGLSNTTTAVEINLNPGPDIWGYPDCDPSIECCD